MKNDQGPTLVPRRRFLILGSAAVATAAAASVAGADVLRSVLVTEETAPQLSVGFLDAGLDDFERALFAPRLTRADRLRAGDSSLDRGVRVHIHGLVRPENATRPLAVGVDAMYRVAGYPEPVPFMAWSHARFHGGSAAGSFVVPVSSAHPLALTVSTSSPATAAESRRAETLQFSLGAPRRQNKLRSGLYFVALLPAGMKAPDWAGVRAVRAENSALPALQQATALGYEPVRFDYLVFGTSRA